MPNALGRRDVAGRVAAKLDAPQAAGRRALDAVLAALTEALGEGHTVTLTRFGTFAVRRDRGAAGAGPAGRPGGAAADRARPPPGGVPARRRAGQGRQPAAPGARPAGPPGLAPIRDGCRRGWHGGAAAPPAALSRRELPQRPPGRPPWAGVLPW